MSRRSKSLKSYQYNYDTSSSSSDSSSDDEYGAGPTHRFDAMIGKHGLLHEMGGLSGMFEPDPGHFDIRTQIHMMLNEFDRKGIFYVPYSGTTANQLLTYISYIFCLYKKVKYNKGSKHFNMDNFLCDPCKLSREDVTAMLRYLTNEKQVQGLPAETTIITNKKDLVAIIQMYNAHKMMDRMQAMGGGGDADEIYERQLGSLLSKKGFGTFLNQAGNDIFAPKAITPCGTMIQAAAPQGGVYATLAAAVRRNTNALEDLRRGNAPAANALQ